MTGYIVSVYPVFYRQNDKLLKDGPKFATDSVDHQSNPNCAVDSCIKNNMNNKIYFPGLNGIRAIAALLVVFSHISLKSSELGFKYGHGIDMAGY